MLENSVREMLTPEEVAKVLRISVATVREALFDGALPGVKIGGVWRIPPDKFETWMEDPKPFRTHSARRRNGTS